MTNSNDDPGPKRSLVNCLNINRPNLCKLKTLAFRALTIIKKEKKLLINSFILLIVTLSPWISEISVNQKVYADIMKYSDPLDPIRAGELCEAIGGYTPIIKENKDDVALAMMFDNPSYGLSQQLAVNTGKNIAGPDRQDATYIVREGETIMQIAERFGLHVGSIIDANNIRAEEAKRISPGTTLKIPSSDTNTSLDWLTAINRAEEQERRDYEAKIAEENRKRQLALQSSRAYAATSSRYASSSGYEGVDNGGIGTPISHNGISRGYSSGHRGIDYMADVGTPVFAAASGKVVITSSGWSGGYGNQIVVDHGGGRSTRYAHLSSIAVGVGQTVGRGAVIGYSGNTGRSTGPHLHFELIINGSPVPPF